MFGYTICPRFIEFAGINKSYIFDVLMVFVPDNAKKICIDKDENILAQYSEIAKTNKELLDWIGYLTMRKELNILKVGTNNICEDLTLDICVNSYDKILISNCKTDYSEHSTFIAGSGIQILDKDLAKVHLNHGQINFPVTKSDVKVEVTVENVFDVVKTICIEFKDLVENKGQFKLLTDKDGKRVAEKTAQSLYYAVAHSYCRSNDLKLSPEVDSGNGPVDFNLSKGFKANVNVEVKIADNSKLAGGLWSQLAIYNRAEGAARSIYLIIKYNTLYDAKINELLEAIELRKSKGQEVPEIFIVDSTFQKSASTRDEKSE